MTRRPGGPAVVSLMVAVVGAAAVVTADVDPAGRDGARLAAVAGGAGAAVAAAEEAQRRFRIDPRDPLFAHDGSDDEDGDGAGDGAGATRMLTEATVLMRIPLHPNATLKHDPEIRFVTVRRGIPTTINTPALDPVLMADGRQPSLEDVMRHYRTFFAIASDVDGPGPQPPLVDLKEQDQRDIIAFMKRLD